MFDKIFHKVEEEALDVESYAKNLYERIQQVEQFIESGDKKSAKAEIRALQRYERRSNSRLNKLIRNFKISARKFEKILEKSNSYEEIKKFKENEFEIIRLLKVYNKFLIKTLSMGGTLSNLEEEDTQIRNELVKALEYEQGIFINTKKISEIELNISEYISGNTQGDDKLKLLKKWGFDISKYSELAGYLRIKMEETSQIYSVLTTLSGFDAALNKLYTEDTIQTEFEVIHKIIVEYKNKQIVENLNKFPKYYKGTYDVLKKLVSIPYLPSDYIIKIVELFTKLGDFYSDSNSKLVFDIFNSAEKNYIIWILELFVFLKEKKLLRKILPHLIGPLKKLPSVQYDHDLAYSINIFLPFIKNKKDAAIIENIIELVSIQSGDIMNFLKFIREHKNYVDAKNISLIQKIIKKYKQNTNLSRSKMGYVKGGNNFIIINNQYLFTHFLESMTDLFSEKDDDWFEMIKEFSTSNPYFSNFKRTLTRETFGLSFEFVTDLVEELIKRNHSKIKINPKSYSMIKNAMVHFGYPPDIQKLNLNDFKKLLIQYIESLKIMKTKYFLKGILLSLYEEFVSLKLKEGVAPSEISILDFYRHINETIIDKEVLGNYEFGDWVNIKTDPNKIPYVIHDVTKEGYKLVSNPENNLGRDSKGELGRYVKDSELTMYSDEFWKSIEFVTKKGFLMTHGVAIFGSNYDKNNPALEKTNLSLEQKQRNLEITIKKQGKYPISTASISHSFKIETFGPFGFILKSGYIYRAFQSDCGSGNKNEHYRVQASGTPVPVQVALNHPKQGFYNELLVQKWKIRSLFINFNEYGDILKEAKDNPNFKNEVELICNTCRKHKLNLHVIHGKDWKEYSYKNPNLVSIILNHLGFNVTTPKAA